MWHYAGDGRTYHNTKTQVSDDGATWYTVFDSAVSGEYVETAAGKTSTFTARNVRYIRDYLNGSTANIWNHWVEIEAYGSRTVAHVGSYYEWTGNAAEQVKYYSAGGQRVAMRTGTGTGTTGLKWLLDDHLGSTAFTLEGATLAKISEARYKPWGELSYAWGTTPTERRYTGQRAEGIGLYDYGARFYDPSMGRFTSPDTHIPEQSQGVQAWDRYAYSNNNSVRFTDSTGHSVDCAANDYACQAQVKEESGGTSPQNGEILDENGWDYVPVVSDVRGVVRGIQTMDVASGQPGFLDQQAALQTWYNNCYGVCHGSSPIPGSPSGGPMPNVPLVDMYSQGMGEAASGATNLLMTAALVESQTQIINKGGPLWHYGLETKSNWSIIHIGNAPKFGGVHIAIGSVAPYQAWFHIYFKSSLPFIDHFFIP